MDDRGPSILFAFIVWGGVSVGLIVFPLWQWWFG